jgi:hypothetical protein
VFTDDAHGAESERLQLLTPVVGRQTAIVENDQRWPRRREERRIDEAFRFAVE